MKTDILTNNIAYEKDLLRSSFKRIRSHLDLNFVESRSAIIYKKFMKLVNIRKFNAICVYASFNNEVLTKSIIDFALSNGVAVAIPYFTDSVDIKLKYITNYDSDVKSCGKYSVPEPSPFLDDANVADISLFIIPAIVFDEHCNRVGFSNGYYDRLLSSNKNALRIGLSYDYQILPVVPKEEHDEILDLIISESKIVSAFL